MEYLFIYVSAKKSEVGRSRKITVMNRNGGRILTGGHSYKWEGIMTGNEL
jgi:hypothetical protein